MLILSSSQDSGISLENLNVLLIFGDCFTFNRIDLLLSRRAVLHLKHFSAVGSFELKAILENTFFLSFETYTALHRHV